MDVRGRQAPLDRSARVETRHRTRGFLLGLLADLPRKNCWTIAEHAGDRDPHGMQHMLARASWLMAGWVSTKQGWVQATP